MAEFNLPGYGFNPQNALINFAPINNAIDTYSKERQNALTNRRADQQIGMQQDRLGMERQKFKREEEDARFHQAGKMAHALSQQPPEVQARAAPMFFKQFPEVAGAVAKIGLDVNDPASHAPALKTLAQAYGGYDPLAEKAKLAQIEASSAASVASRAQSGATTNADRRAELRAPDERSLLQAQARQADKKDEMAEFTVQMLRGATGMPPPAPRAAPAPGVKPMSNPVDPSADPLLIQTQTAGPPIGAGRTSAGTEPTIKVFGKDVPVSQAGAMADALMMNPATKAVGERIHTDLGKMNLQQPLVTDLQKNITHNVDNLARLTEIKRQYRPEFQTVETQLAVMGASLFDRSKTLRTNPIHSSGNGRCNRRCRIRQWLTFSSARRAIESRPLPTLRHPSRKCVGRSTSGRFPRLVASTPRLRCRARRAAPPLHRTWRNIRFPSLDRRAAVAVRQFFPRAKIRPSRWF